MFGSGLDLVRKKHQSSSTFHSIHCSRNTYERGESQSWSDIPGTTKLVRGVSSAITAFGSTNAPVDTSSFSGVRGDEGLEANMTFAK